MRQFQLFAIADDARENHLEIAAIHNDQGFERVRETLATMYDLGMHEPNIQVVGADLSGDRTLNLQHTVYRNRKLDPKSKTAIIEHIKRLWGHKVRLTDVSA